MLPDSRRKKRLARPPQLPVKYKDHPKSRLATIENSWILDPKKPARVPRPLIHSRHQRRRMASDYAESPALTGSRRDAEPVLGLVPKDEIGRRHERYFGPRAVYYGLWHGSQSLSKVREI